jgi:hypothetical protein
MQNTTIRFKSPNSRHFYAHRYRGELQSGLKLDHVKFQNTVIRPGIDVESDVEAIESSNAQYKQRFYLSVHRLSALNLRLSIALAIVLTSFQYFPGSTPKLDLISAFLINLMTAGIAMFGISWIVKQVYRVSGENRVDATAFAFNVTLSLTGFSMLFSYITWSGIARIDILQQIICGIFSFYLIPLVVARLTCWKLNYNRHIKIEHEWIVHDRTYGVHLNQNDQAVLYPKAGEGFYPMNALEYKKLIAYQSTQGDPIKAEELFRLWRSQPLDDEYQNKLMQMQQFNPLALYHQSLRANSRAAVREDRQIQ